MPGEEIKMNWDTFNGNLANRIATSKRDGLAVLAEQAKGIIKIVIEETPPGHKGVPGGTKEADDHGRAKVAGDIAKLYGAPSAAFDAIRAAHGTTEARAFWELHSHGDQAGAQRVVQAAVGGYYGPFDGGKMHDQQFTRGSVKGSKKRPVLYVSNPGELEAFIARQQDRVHFLTAGWKEIAAKLGISLPSMVTRHDAPGVAVIEMTADRLRIVATNAVSYASNTDLERRIQSAIDRQSDSMQRQWETYQHKQLSL